jgi:hypothetical protein
LFARENPSLRRSPTTHGIAEIVSNDFPGTSSEFSGCAASHGFRFQKRSQYFISVYNKTSSILALCGHNPKLSALVIRA